MDVLSLQGFETTTVQCVEMHTTGEPTRIVISGYPGLSGTLLEQRAQAAEQYDYIRKRLMLEPRGHFNMYGAILRQQTELTTTGEAHIGVLFIHNEGYSTMCGHATIALGRFLIDTHDLQIFPHRENIRYDTEKMTAHVNLHAPCGVIQVTVPIVPGGSRSDPSRPVSFISVPSFATAVSLQVEIPPIYRWPELGERTCVQADIAYGGAFYCLVLPRQLGFPDELLRGEVKLQPISKATEMLKRAISKNQKYRQHITHPSGDALSFLYSVMIVDKDYGVALAESSGAETGLCFFADQEVDRSPTGSAVAARVALAFKKGEMKVGQSHTYHSLVSNSFGSRGGFIGTVLGSAESPQYGTAEDIEPIRVQVEGYAYYTGFHTFVVEKSDPMGDNGFLMENM